jgi:energy-coupling factor transporter transmembrane protein EcfT
MANDPATDATTTIIVIVAIFVIIGAIVISAFLLFARAARKRAEMLMRGGPIVCPFCSSVIADNVRYMGQKMTCPHCHGECVAPG